MILKTDSKRWLLTEKADISICSMPEYKQSKTKAYTLDIVEKKESSISLVKINIASRCKTHICFLSILAVETAK